MSRTPTTSEVLAPLVADALDRWLDVPVHSVAGISQAPEAGPIAVYVAPGRGASGYEGINRNGRRWLGADVMVGWLGRVFDIDAPHGGLLNHHGTIRRDYGIDGLPMWVRPSERITRHGELHLVRWSVRVTDYAEVAA